MPTSQNQLQSITQTSSENNKKNKWLALQSQSLCIETNAGNPFRIGPGEGGGEGDPWLEPQSHRLEIGSKIKKIDIKQGKQSQGLIYAADGDDDGSGDETRPYSSGHFPSSLPPPFQFSFVNCGAFESCYHHFLLFFFAGYFFNAYVCNYMVEWRPISN